MGLEQKYLDVLEECGWSVSCYTHDGKVGLETWSPAGENITICVNVKDFPRSVMEYAYDFDADRHVEELMEAKRNGLAGVPSISTLVRDADEIQKLLDELAGKLISLNDNRKDEENMKTNEKNTQIMLGDEAWKLALKLRYMDFEDKVRIFRLGENFTGDAWIAIMEKYTPEQVKEISGYLNRWDEVDFDDKRRIVDLMISAIYATSESINIVWKI